MSQPPEPPAQPAGSGTIGLASWNIRSGRDARLAAACRSMNSLDVDIAILQETKVTDGFYPRSAEGYSIVATEAKSNRSGGVALVWREGDKFELEETKVWGTNVISFEC